MSSVHASPNVAAGRGGAHGVATWLGFPALTSLPFIETSLLSHSDLPATWPSVSALSSASSWHVPARFDLMSSRAEVAGERSGVASALLQCSRPLIAFALYESIGDASVRSAMV